jgi:hypothetical protein
MTRLCVLVVVLWATTAQAQHLGFVVGPTAPTNAEAGDFWSDTTSNTLKKFNGVTWDDFSGGGGSSAWGGITGTLSNQTDLQNALDAKQAAGSYATAAQGATADSALQPAGNGGSLTGLTKTQVGLSNVDNTSDAGKPVSSATQTALDGKQATLVSATNIKTINGSTVLGSGDLVVSGGGGLAAGDIIIRLSACGAGFEEATELNGVTVIGTLAANADVGTTGGADTITGVINHTHPVTDPGHVHVENSNNVTTGGLRGWAAADTSTNTSTATGYSTASATTGVTTTDPAGGVASLDNRSAFVRVIFCRKT